MRYCLGSPTDLSNLWAALALMPFGLAFDFMDGKVARWQGKSSLMGQELDSLADLVCLKKRTLPLPETDPAFTRSLLALRLLLVPSLWASVHLLTTSSSPSSLFAASCALLDSTLPLRLFQKMLLESHSTLRAHLSLPLCRYQLLWRSGPAKDGYTIKCLLEVLVLAVFGSFIWPPSCLLVMDV